MWQHYSQGQAGGFVAGPRSGKQLIAEPAPASGQQTEEGTCAAPEGEEVFDAASQSLLLCELLGGARPAGIMLAVIMIAVIMLAVIMLAAIMLAVRRRFDRYKSVMALPAKLSKSAFMLTTVM
eukprot:gene22959-27769_t